MFLLTLAISPCWTQLSKKDVVSVIWQKICIKYKFYNPFSLKFLKHSNGPLYPLKSPLEQGQNYCCLHMMVSANVVKSSFLHFTWKKSLNHSQSTSTWSITLYTKPSCWNCLPAIRIVQDVWHMLNSFFSQPLLTSS